MAAPAPYLFPRPAFRSRRSLAGLRCRPHSPRHGSPTPSRPRACARSHQHCKIVSSDEDADVWLYDFSTNGTFVNSKSVGKGNRAPLRSGDTITLLNPSMPENWQFLFQDLRAPAAAPAAVQTPAAAAQLLQGTSFNGNDMLNEECGSAVHYDEVSELGRGAFAVVKKVVHRKTGQAFAMKVMEKKKLLGQLRRKPGVQVRP